MNERAVYKFFQKLNTLNTYKDAAKEAAKTLLELTDAQACRICLLNPANGKIAIKHTEYSDTCFKPEVEEIYSVCADFLTNTFEPEDALDYFDAISKNDKIIEPVIYRENLLGYMGLMGKTGDFNKTNSSTVGIIMENVNSRLEIISLLEEIEKSERERVEFLASISHEFKTPLNSIIGFSDVLKHKNDNPGNDKYIDNISKSSGFLLELIQDVLDLAKAENRPMELKYETFRPKDVISDIIWGFEEERKEKNIEINYTLSDVELAADLKRFKQLIYNLISNAVKFNKQNGKIMIVTYVNEDKEFVFEIKDTGDGISKKDCAKIFNFFSQVNRSRLKRQQGSGLGLALCKTIAKAHKGDIYFKSRLNTGSTFWFELPMFGCM
ncbi:MAG: HAMP domain-containing histidine kinase [Heliobacteriaceae bacterium]|jgi:signal transduction histidine kinase|nr:HAMP domain-containing histidine kinase [Heliobacteriaceae bacterium]